MNVKCNLNRIRPTRKILAASLFAALCGTYAIDAGATSPSGPSPIARATTLRAGDAVIGALPMSHPIHIEVALKLRNKDALDAFIANNAKLQASGSAQQTMSPAQVLANHAPTQAQAAAVAEFLTSRGFRNVTIAPNRLLVSADGTALTAGNTFATTFAQVRTHDGRIAFANTGAVRIPAALSDKVLAVVGLQTVHQADAGVQRIDPNAPHTQLVMTHDPIEFASIYGASSYYGSGALSVAVGIVSSGSIGPRGGITQTISDLNTFSALHAFTPVESVIVNTNGTTNTPVSDAPSALASQSILGITQGQVQKFIFYNMPAPTTANLTANLNKIVAQDAVKVIDDAFGVCETDAQADGSAAAQDAIFQLAVAQGQTFAVSTGNPGGADQCGNGSNTPRWPASSQYVVAVAGTKLNASGTTWSSETVYPQSGGSASTFEPMPQWQATFGVPGGTRVAADVAFDATPSSGAKIWVKNVLTPLGGNALAAALFAGQWAALLQQRTTGFGFAGPVLYAVTAADFHDVTSGSNDGGVPGVGSTAALGYDAASGRGSGIFAKLVADSAGLGNHPPQAIFRMAVIGRTVHITDQSTDDNNTIVAHAWQFSDGGTSTSPNPVHQFPGKGTFVITESVTDQQGAVGTTNRSLTIGPLQLMMSPGFELPGLAAGWTFGGSNSAIQIDQGAIDGCCDWRLTTLDNGGTLAQTVTIPEYEGSATLAFDYRLITFVASSTQTDMFKVMVNTPEGVPLATLATLSNHDATPGSTFVRPSFDVTPFIGQTIQIQFIASSPGHVNDAILWLDDITLIGTTPTSR